MTLERLQSPGADQLVLTVEDDGTGPDSAATEGAGIRGMRERVQSSPAARSHDHPGHARRHRGDRTAPVAGAS
ncbi:hypothetical protein [Microbacterium terregens]|uniref:hypothetical protein n=1 Tax=Microbacterium terregens TaxID=69363 RepID=UPI003CD0551A